MIIIGVDFHPEFQQIASVDTETGELQERQQLESFRLAPWVSRRRHDLLELLDRLNPSIAELSQAVEQEVENCPEAQRLATHPVSVPSPPWRSC